ncbi:MAG: hypothetical protein GKR89_01495 [Candidatus Latescibacteria bacterium]|nr:hypothetical protein [Candidatus Latescibacterota bacterium]
MRFYAAVGLVLAVLAAAPPVQGHESNTSYSRVFVLSDSLKVIFAIDQADVENRFPLDANDDGSVQGAELLQGGPLVAEFVEESLWVRLDGDEVEWSNRRCATTLSEEGVLFLNITYEAALEEEPRTAAVGIDFSGKFGDDHKNLSKITVPGKFVRQAIFSADKTSHRFALSDQVSIWDHVAEFTVLGIEHIFLGYDHIMFLLALIVVGGRLRNLIKIVTAFTLAHSITLVLAALDLVQLPSKWIEAGIALSIAYVALENFWLKRSDYRWVLTFFFGLVHGFGFANVLRELGLPNKGLAVSLLSFNIGVELGQVAIVVLVFPLIVWISRQAYKERVVQVVSGVIFLFGVAWLVERVFEFSYMPI